MLTATIPGRSAAEITRAFGALRRKRPGLGRAVSHIVVSFRPDAPRVPDGIAVQVAESLMNRLMYEGFFCVRHDNHLHIVASRIRFDGSVVPDAHDYRRAEEAVRDLEREHGIASDQRSRLLDPSAPARARGYERAEAGRHTRTGDVPVRLALQEAIDGALGEGRATVATLARRLKARGVSMAVHASKSGRVAGVSFSLGGVAMKGSAIGRLYGWAGLQAQGVTYDHENRNNAHEGQGGPGECPADPAAPAAGDGDGGGPGAGPAPQPYPGDASAAGPQPLRPPERAGADAAPDGLHAPGGRGVRTSPGERGESLGRPAQLDPAPGGSGASYPGGGAGHLRARGGEAPSHGREPVRRLHPAGNRRDALAGVASEPDLTSDRAEFLWAHNRARRRSHGAAADLSAVLTLMRSGFSPARVKVAWQAAIGGPVGVRLAAHIRRTVARAVALLREGPGRGLPKVEPQQGRKL